MRSDGQIKDLLCEEEPIGLSSVTPDREAIFRKAVRAFTKADHKGLVPSLTDARYERPLYIHTAALAIAQGREVKVDELMEDTLDHEERFWREQIERVDIGNMRRVVAALTLKGGVGSEAEVRKFVEIICGAADKKMAFLLRALYPGRDANYINGLEPDLLGEALVLRTLSKEGAGAGSYLDRVFDGADGGAIRTGFTVLGRLSEDHKKAENWITRVLDRDVAGRALEAFAAAKIVGERTAHAAVGIVLAKALEREGTADLATRLERVLPHPEQTVSLREVGQWVTATRLAHLPKDEGEERARLLNNLSTWQSALGQREAALASTQEAADIYRTLAAARPETFLPGLAMSLNNLSVDQSDLGQREAALASTQEAVDIYRTLAAARPGAFLPDLAMSLNNLGIMQSDLGQREAALASTQEAVDIRRTLAAARPEAFLPDLAVSLNNLGMMQSDLGQREAALASTQEAVNIRRTLAAARPEAFLPDLAGSLNNLSVDQSALGRREAAFASTQEAVDIYRTLSAARPGSFLPDLAGSIDNLGIMQSALGQREEALASTQEAVNIRRTLAAARPEAFLPDLADSIDNLGNRQSALGQREEALASTQEAVNIRRTLAAARPEAFLPDLAGSLSNLGIRQSALGQREAALASTQEAVNIRRTLAAARPEAFLPNLARSLNNLGNRQSARGQREEALASTQEALDAIWPLFLRLPAAFEEDTGDYLAALHDRLTALNLPPTPDLLARLETFASLTRRPAPAS
ncbi:MAG: tetratricopeptide repeat protein [Minicystis sp.]